MYIDNCPTVDSMLIKALRQTKEIGVSRKPKWQRCGCVEIPEPVIIELTNPMARFCTLGARKQNIALAVAESVWIMAGLNNLDDLPGHYAKSIYQYSDDGVTYRAGYGPRIRFWNGGLSQYHINFTKLDDLKNDLRTGVYYVDQLLFCVQQLRKDPYTRQAVITIHDPYKDDFVGEALLCTKDTPCTRSVQFMCDNKGNLNCYVHMRSNDILHGMSAINVAEFTFMQQIVSQVCNLPIGKYYHIVNNSHYYEDLQNMVDACLEEDLPIVPGIDDFRYDSYPLELTEVDDALNDIIYDAYQYQQGKYLDKPNRFADNPKLQVFSDYAEVFRMAQCRRHGMECVNPNLIHPQLQYLYSQGRIK